jgi:hypothetical protein
MGDLTIPGEAVEAALLGAMGYDAVHDDDSPKGDEYFAAQMASAVVAAGPLIVAAELQRMLDDAFPNEDSDYYYGCERLIVHVISPAPVGHAPWCR